MTVRPPRSTVRRPAKAAAVCALAAALAVAVLPTPALADPAPEQAASATSAAAAPLAWIAGLVHGLIDPLLGSPADRADVPNDLDRVHGTVGSGFDPNGASGEPSGGDDPPAKSGRD